MVNADFAPLLHRTVPVTNKKNFIALKQYSWRNLNGCAHQYCEHGLKFPEIILAVLCLTSFA